MTVRRSFFFSFFRLQSPCSLSDKLYSVTGLDDYAAGIWQGNASTIPNNTLVRWSITDHTMFLNFSDPTINHVADTNFPPEKALIFENFGPNDWVYLIIEGTPDLTRPPRNKTFLPIAHPVSKNPFFICQTL